MKGIPLLRRFSPRRSAPPGARPGMLLRPSGAVETRIDVCSYDELALEEYPSVDVDRALEEIGRHRVLWIRAQGLKNVSELGRLADALGMHRLALEDVIGQHSRPKIEDYEHLSFFVGRSVELTEEAISHQVAVFWGRNFVLSFEDQHDRVLSAILKRLRAARGRIRQLGADYLAYALIDKVVDDYQPVLEAYEDNLDELEERALADESEGSLPELHVLRAQLTELRRNVRPLREAVRLGMDGEAGNFTEDVQVYLRDTHDHAVQAIETCDALRENIASVMDLVFSLQSQRMNDIIKVLTVISTIFIPLSFLAGLYGMNFDPERSGNMPELRQPYAYPVLLSVMFGISVAMLVWFWRRGWIFRRRRR